MTEEYNPEKCTFENLLRYTAEGYGDNIDEAEIAGLTAGQLRNRNPGIERCGQANEQDGIFTAWTKRFVYFPYRTDMGEWEILVVPRNPCNIATCGGVGISPAELEVAEPEDDNDGEFYLATGHARMNSPVKFQELLMKPALETVRVPTDKDALGTSFYSSHKKIVRDFGIQYLKPMYPNIESYLDSLFTKKTDRGGYRYQIDYVLDPKVPRIGAVGMCISKHKFAGGNKGSIISLFLDPFYRRSGVGLQLLRSAFDFTRTTKPKIKIPVGKVKDYEVLIRRYGWILADHMEDVDGMMCRVYNKPTE